MYYVLFEEWKLADLPTELNIYLDWASSYNYLVIVDENKLRSYNKFTNEFDARRYGYTHEQPVLTISEINVPEYPLGEL
jgi:hypothetical protein